MSLSSRCLIIDLSLGMWEGFKLDKIASEETNLQARAKAGTARVTKRIVPSETFKRLITARNALKAHVEAHSLPWKDNGERILMRNMFERFIERFGVLEKEFVEAADEFCDKLYPESRERAAFNDTGMGRLFNPDDYPAPDTLRHRFYVTLKFEPLPDSDDFRVKLDQVHVDAIKKQMDDTLNQRLTAAMKDVWMRLVTIIQHYADKMADENAIFRDSTVNNMIELVDTLPGLNVLGDPNMKSIRRRLAETLYQVDPDTLRKDTAVRAQAAKDAQDILDDMRGFIDAV